MTLALLVLSILILLGVIWIGSFLESLQNRLLEIQFKLDEVFPDNNADDDI